MELSETLVKLIKGLSVKINYFFYTLLLYSVGIYLSNLSIAAQNNLKNKEEIEQLMQQYLKPKTVVSTAYDEFKFSSNEGSFFNRYSGHTNFTSIGGDNLKINGFYGGISFYNITTHSDSTAFLGTLSHNQNTIEENGIYVHLMKQIFSFVVVDLFGSYGFDRFKLTSAVNIAPDILTGYARYGGSDTTIGARTFFGQTYKALYLQGELTYFYNNFHQNNYTINYPQQAVPVEGLTSNIGAFLERARIYYQVNDQFSPFISGGLIQLASRRYSRPIINPNFTAVSPLPQILIGRNGYSYGAGFNYIYKSIRVTPAYVHSVRGREFHDNYVGMTIELMAL